MSQRNNCICRDHCDGTCRKNKPFVEIDKLPEDEQERLWRNINAFLGDILSERLFSSISVSQPNPK